MDTYTIKLESIAVSRTRSHHADTNYLTFFVMNGIDRPIKINAKLGDMSDGDYCVGDLIDRTPQPSPGIGSSNAADFIEISNPADPVIIGWAIMNRGYAFDQQAITEISRVGDKLIRLYRADDIPAPHGIGDTAIDSNGWGSSSDWDAILDWVFEDLAAPPDAGCDGALVAQVFTTSVAELAAKTQGGAPFSKILQYPGIHSAYDCGASSLYFVTYSIAYEHIPDSTPRRRM